MILQSMILHIIFLTMFQALGQDFAIAQGIETIKSIDLDDEHPTMPNAQYSVMPLKTPKGHQVGQVIIRQFSSRVRLEFEGDGLPKATYIIGLANACLSQPTISSALFKKSWYELHRFTWETPHYSTEKSFSDYTLNGQVSGAGAKPAFMGHALALLRARGSRFDMIACTIVK